MQQIQTNDPDTLDACLDATHALSSSLYSKANECLRKAAAEWRSSKHDFMRAWLEKHGSDASPTAIAEALEHERDARGRAALEQLIDEDGTLPKLLARFDLVKIIQQADRDEEKVRAAKEQEIKLAIQTDSPFLSRVPEWLADETKRRMRIWDEEAGPGGRAYLVARKVAEKCRAAGLGTEAWLIERDLEVSLQMPDEDSLVAKVRRTHRRPEEVETFRRPIIFPSNYRVTKRKDGDRYSYTLVTHTEHTVSKDRVGWRLSLLYQTSRYTLNAGILAWTWLLWCSPVSLRALFCFEPFKHQYGVDQNTGNIIMTGPDAPTLVSRLKAVWRTVASSRTKFEAELDIGLISKKVTRVFNVLWNYVVVGVCGTTLVLVFQPVLTALASVVGIVMLVTWGLWAPAAAILGYASNILLVDSLGYVSYGRHRLSSEGYLPGLRAIVYDIGLAGIGRIGASLALNLAVRPPVAGVASILRVIPDIIFIICLIRSVRLI